MSVIEVKIAQEEAQIADAIYVDKAHMGKEGRENYLRGLAQSGLIFVVYRDGVPVGYAATDPFSFYYRPFLALLVVHPDHRRAGFGAILIESVERGLAVEKLYTSVVSDNDPMIMLLAKLGYEKCGHIVGLDEGPPEWVFSKIFSKADEKRLV